MRLLSINGVIETSVTPDVIQRIAEGLGERFERVEQSEGSVEAESRSLNGLVLRGPRTHPMLPFNRVRVELAEGNPGRVRVHLDGTMQVSVALFLVLAVGLGTSVERGLVNGMAMGLLFGGSFFLLNYILSRVRAVTWLSNRARRASF